MIVTLQIFPGPEPKRNQRLVGRLNAMSDFSRGSVIAMAYSDEIFEIGNYKVILIAYSRFKFLSNIKLLIASLAEAFRLNRNNALNMVVSYDPLKVGLYGLLIKLLFRAKLLIEVNGEFNSPDLYNFKPGPMGYVKRVFYPNLKRFLLYWADGVKGLFTGQLAGVKLRERTVVDYFFDHTPIEAGEYKANDKNVLLTLGYPAHVKGIDLLIKAFLDLPQKYDNWSLEIYGWFDDYELEKLNLLTDGCQRIIIEKPIDFTEVPAKLDSCNLFVLASRTEGVPRVLLESMARGRARIGSRVGGIPGLIEDGVDGLLFDKGDISQLSAALIDMMNSEEKRKEMAKKGIERFNSQFTLQAYIKLLKAFYSRIV
jgi:glycosyltransferase involved in cell wall biosynthesis